MVPTYGAGGDPRELKVMIMIMGAWSFEWIALKRHVERLITKISKLIVVIQDLHIGSDIGISVLRFAGCF